MQRMRVICGIQFGLHSMGSGMDVETWEGAGACMLVEACSPIRLLG